MKQTWKRRQISQGDVEAALRAHKGNVTKAAKVLGLARETLSRWLRADRPVAKNRGAGNLGSKQHRRCGAGTWVRRNYALTPIEKEFLEQAEMARAIAHDKNASDTARLAAMREFRAAIKDLDLPEFLDDGEIKEKSQASVSRFPRRVG